MAEKTKSLEGRIAFDDINTVEATLTDVDGCKITKRITRDEFIKVLMLENEVWEDIPRLPMGTAKTKWLDEKNYRIAIYVPGDVRPTIFLKKEKPLMIPFPNLIFYFDIKNGTKRQSYVFSVKEEFAGLKDETKLYNFPYGNVSPGSGNICWGGNTLGTINAPLLLEKMIGLFFDAPMNTDLYQPGISSKEDLPLELLLTTVNGEDRFDKELLVPTGHTIGSLFKD